MTVQRILIVGGGVAGPTLALLLAKHLPSSQITILERSTTQSELGQVVDIEGPSQEIMSRLNLLPLLREASTHEQGIEVVNEQGGLIGRLPAGQSGGASKEIEIMRPRLSKVIYNATREYKNVQWRFGKTVTAIEERQDDVLVEVSDVETKETQKDGFDLVVAADGLRSKTRNLILPANLRKDCIKSLDVYIAFFSLPAEVQDRPYSRLLSLPGSRNALIKPIDENISSAYLSVANHDDELSEARRSRDTRRKREIMSARFKGSGWETDRMAREILTTDNFYFEEISQIKLNKWSHGKCVLLGDTAWCPSPLTGQGTNTAVLGAYILAHCIITHSDNLEKAFAEYEQMMRGYVDKIQAIPLGGRLPKLINPDSGWGIWIQRTIIGAVSRLGLYKYIPESKVDYEGLPDL
ncbi:uncharacterized protein F5Z01DRAFT_244631 [Emericellopsis atlantica]|uniref:FAD-binding domain-containing protein n=1 Tax=Emericellopsis atlantica TaxID=2614577 RepID=A0A9P7ZHU7_9HYPO|nr:uncharacterized protein F5Z01DRAFT_244631 [Emericellopsis atlantica]KAG9252006.1 hypothetical protein F5Z01DRAFT_244631 [Emericellopsis atlantica]